MIRRSICGRNPECFLTRYCPAGSAAQGCKSANEAIGGGVEIVSPCCNDGIQTIDGAAKFAKDAGFTSVRCAVHLSTKQATTALYNVDAAWLAKIDAELDVLLGNGFTVILTNNDDQGDQPRTGDRLVALWTQIGEYFKDRRSSLYFAIENEPTWYDQNDLLSNELKAEELNPRCSLASSRSSVHPTQTESSSWMVR